jgi:hypothetical protein
MGPALHYWYGALDRLFGSTGGTIKKLLCDQLMFAPFFNGAFMIGTGALEGHSMDAVLSSANAAWWPSMKANWKVRISKRISCSLFCLQGSNVATQIELQSACARCIRVIGTWFIHGCRCRNFSFPPIARE